MFRKNRRARRLNRCAGLLGWAMLGWSVIVAAELQATDADEPMILGLVQRAEIEAEMPDWIAAGVAAEPDLEAAAGLVGALAGAEVTVFFGTWCADSGRELPRLWRALDEMGVLDPPEIRYVGINRDKTEPAEHLAGQNLQLVPTFVVVRGGVETGRIVESSPNGIENDLLALLRGDETGLITDSPDLAAERGEP